MKTIQNCFRDSLGSCEALVQARFLSVLQSVTHSAYLADDPASFPPSPVFRSIDSVRSGNQEVNICVKRFKDVSNENNTLSDNDLCDPLLSSNNMSGSHVLKKSCEGDDVTRWLSDVKKCVYSNSLSSKSPHGFMLVTLLKVIKGCNEDSALECRPKERKEFKSIVNSLFYIMNLFAVPSGSSSCLSDLKVDNIVRCHNHLHQYLVLDFKSSPEMHKRKTEDCLTGALKSCSKSFVLDLLSVLEKSVGKPSLPLASSDGSYVACEPGTQNFPRNAQEYKKYCRPRSSPTEPMSPDSVGFRKLPVHGDKEPSYGNARYQGYEYSEEKDDFDDYGMRNGDYGLIRGGSKSDENYAFYMSDLSDMDSEEPSYVDAKPDYQHSYGEEPGISLYGENQGNRSSDTDFRPSYEVEPAVEHSYGQEKIDGPEVGVEGGDARWNGMSLMFRSLDQDDEENVDRSGNAALMNSTEYSRSDGIPSTVPVLETSSGSGKREGDGSNEIPGQRKGSVDEVTGSPKKYNDVENCTIDDFDSYLDPLFDCQNIRMSLLFSANNSTCANVTERSFESLSLCLFEHKVPLTCEVSSRKQIEDFLSFLSLRLDTVMTYYRRRCSLKEHPCYASGTRGFAQCTNEIYNHLVEPTAVGGPLKVFQCLASAVPKCSSKIPLMFLPSVYLPLGMNLSTVLQETKEKRCLAATTEDIPSSSVCTKSEQEAAKQDIYNCLNRTNQKINESLQGQTLQWSVLPMTVCVSVHPVLECRLADLHEFRQFVTSLLAGMEAWLREFFKIFVDEADRKKGEDCLLHFSSPALDKCLPLLFDYMNRFHSGLARDYPSECVEEAFGGCGDVDTFHLLMKKSMNVTYEGEKSVTACVRMENEVRLKNCDVGQFDGLLRSENECQRGDDALLDTEEPVDFCKDCVLGNVKEMCAYEMPQLRDVVAFALKRAERCLKTQDVGKTCVQNVKLALEDECLFDFHAYVSNVKRGRYMKAAHFSRNTYNCIIKTVTQCSSEVHSSLFNLYSRICGVESLSNYRADYVLGLNQVVNEIMKL